MNIYNFFLLLSGLSFLLFIILLISIKNKKKYWYVYLLLILSFLVFGALKVYSIVDYVIKHRSEIISKTIDATSEIVSKSLTLTAANFEKNWDKQVIEELENITIGIKSVNYEKKDNAQKCILELIIINNVTNNDRKLYIHDLLENNYIVAYDTDDFVHTISVKEYENDKIPQGKSKGFFEVNIDDNIKIQGLSFLGKKIEIKE